MTNDPRQKLADHLQAAIPLVQRLHVTSKQQLQDAADALAALERAVALIRSWLPTVDRHVRVTDHLGLALLRSGHAVPEIAFLTAIPESHLRQVIAGAAVPTPEERLRLKAVLADWTGGGR